jgi:hypothetical protein
MNDGSRRLGVALLVLETWIVSVVAFACEPRHAGFWLSFLPVALLLPANGIILSTFSGWKKLAASFALFMSAPIAAALLRPVIYPWLVDVVLTPRFR